MNPSSVHETSNSVRSSGNSGGSASCRKCETPCARLTTPMTRASRLREPTGKVIVEFTLATYSKLLLSKFFCYELTDGDNLLDHRRMLDRVHVPLNRPAPREQRVARTFCPRELNDRVVRAMRHEHRNVAIRGACLGRHAVGADQVRRQSDQSAQTLGVAQAGVQRDRAALRKAGEQHAPRRDAARRLARHKRLDVRL